MSDLVILKTLDKKSIRYEYHVGVVPSIQHFDSLKDQEKTWSYFIRDLVYYSLQDAEHVADFYAEVAGHIDGIYHRNI